MFIARATPNSTSMLLSPRKFHVLTSSNDRVKFFYLKKKCILYIFLRQTDSFSPEKRNNWFRFYRVVIIIILHSHVTTTTTIINLYELLNICHLLINLPTKPMLDIDIFQLGARIFHSFICYFFIILYVQ